MPAFPCRLNPCGPQSGLARVPGGRWVLAFPSSPRELSPTCMGLPRGAVRLGDLVGLCVVSHGISSWKGPQEQCLRVPWGVSARDGPAALNWGSKKGFFPSCAHLSPQHHRGPGKAPRVPCSGGYLCLQRHLSGAACTHRTGAGGSRSYQGLHEGVVGNFIVEARR